MIQVTYDSGEVGKYKNAKQAEDAILNAFVRENIQPEEIQDEDGYCDVVWSVKVKKHKKVDKE